MNPFGKDFISEFFVLNLHISGYFDKKYLDEKKYFAKKCVFCQKRLLYSKGIYDKIKIMNSKKGKRKMKTIKNKELLVGADFAGYPLKEAVCEHLRKKGWKITDVGVRADSDPDDTDLMFHRVGLRVGSMIAEKEFERALIFCGTGMGIHIAASKCPHVHAGVVESVPAALRAITGNGVNVLAMGAFYVAPAMGCDIADAYLNAELGSGYEWWKNFYEFHKLAIDELEAFDYEEYKKNGFKVNKLGDFPLKLETKED